MSSPTVQELRVQVAPGVRLRVRHTDGTAPPYLLVHGLSSNARLWDGVAVALAAAGHRVAAVDLRGHGESDAPAEGYSTEQAAADLVAVRTELGLDEPVVAGQSWGGNVVLTHAAAYGGLRGLALLDGGWLHLADRFATFDDCWAQLAPPAFTGIRATDIRSRLTQWHPDWPDWAIDATLGNLREGPDGTVTARLDRDHHREILQSMWAGQPRTLYPKVGVPVLLLPAGDPAGPSRALIDEAAAGLPDARVHWYAGADHDLHAQHAAEVAADLQTLP